MTAVAPLTPEVLDRLRILQQKDRPISVDEILVAANLNHLTQQPSKSSSTMVKKIVPSSSPSSLSVIGNLEKSVSTSTLAERRRLPLNPEKLKLYSQINQKNGKNASNSVPRDEKVLKRLEEENAKLPTQDSEEYMLAHLERQNALLNADPKSICIESNRLQTDFDTIRNLVSDATFSPTRENYEETIQAMLAKAPLKENACENQDEWDFWQEIVNDYSTAVAKLPHLLAAKLRCGGIPHRIRGVIWQAMAQSSSLNLESLYVRLSEESESSSYERVIQRDLSRTFPQLDMFKDDGGEGQLAMGRLLKAYSLYDAHVGYCQGLAFLVGPLLMTMPENQAFCVFVRLMETYEMRTMFTLNMEGLHLRLHQFGVLLSQLCPRLDAHLNENSIHPAMYASQWYLTLFAYSFPISLVLRIYDLVFAEGAVETITRVAIAIMQKNEDTLCEIDDFEQLMMYLSSRKLYEVAYGSDPEAVIGDAMGLSTIITKQKMDSISEAYYHEIEQEKTRAHQVLAIRFDGWGTKASTSPTSNKKPTHNKRDSWFPWGGAAAAIESPTSTEKIRRDSNASSTPSSLTTSQTDIAINQLHQQQDRTIPLLHEQIEDLVTAMSQLQKENTRISEDLMAKQMKEMDLMTEREHLLKRNATLENALKQQPNPVNDQPSPVESVDGDNIVEIEDKNKLKNLQKQAEFRGFVESLKLSGDFGTLIAGALTSSQDHQQHASVIETEGVTSNERSITHPHQIEAVKKENSSNSSSGLDEVTSELVSIKLANFEMGLKYQNLCQEREKLLKSLNSSTEGQVDLVNKIVSLQSTVEALEIDKEELLQEHERLMEENEELNQKILATKKTCSDLQLEKMTVDSECQRLQERVKELEDQRREYLMPRGSFTEEVFAAHETLFGSKPEAPAMSRRHTVQMTCGVNEYDDTFQKKYIESDLRCRELEKLLAETKFRLVEYETASNGGVSNTSSPRGSLQQNKRPTSAIQTKRSSLSMLVKVNSNNGGSTGGPHSPPYTDSRESTDSLRSTTSNSSLQRKRSSVYSRFLNALGTGPLTEEAQAITEEPRH